MCFRGHLLTNSSPTMFVKIETGICSCSWYPILPSAENRCRTGMYILLCQEAKVTWGNLDNARNSKLRCFSLANSTWVNSEKHRRRYAKGWLPPASEDRCHSEMLPERSCRLADHLLRCCGSVFATPARLLYLNTSRILNPSRRPYIHFLADLDLPSNASSPCRCLWLCVTPPA